MAKAVVTLENVSAIAEELLARGEDPTLLKVHEQLGGGSYSTVKRYLDAWRSAREQPPVIEVPPELATKALSVIQTLWSAAVTQADQRVAQVQAAAQQQIATAQAELAQAETMIQRHEAQIETLTEQLTETRDHLAEREQAAAQAQSAAQRAEARVAEQARSIADLRVELKAATERAETAVTAQARLDGELTALRQQLATQHALLERLGRPSADVERAG